ncbi:MAG: hypothetical protein JO325_21095, partial [Solirubrobacterales bacterium]|nr:hypothetical protein [Solirubrobacterales bacterium]
TRIRWDINGGQGTNFNVESWADSSPQGDNPPIGQAVVFYVSEWNGNSGVQVWLGNAVYTLTTNQNDFHTYQLQYHGGQYTASVDGVQVLGPVTGLPTPNTIYIGNPNFGYWTSSSWGQFDVDYVRVTAP